uniref:Kinesin-like protein n=1 Tax=Pyramimonas obovata TaxID=1411642 RepID=A0A7S0RP80_9CHLO|mmetsp:Transcript_39455/g.85876  ORF Transcript_39455/g.85876 Transcript_39455/m.85876 type:complete len:817 (+) Transcript_39455:234-2684(+)
MSGFLDRLAEQNKGIRSGSATSPKPRPTSARTTGRPPSARGTASAGVATPSGVGASTPRASSPSGRGLSRKSSVNATNETIRKQIGGQLAGAPALPTLAERTNNPGRVRVALRVRPQVEQEIKEGHAVCTTVEPETGKVFLRRNQWDEDIYQFDTVFGESASQIRVYESVAAPIVESVMKGFNGTVMAYGQTGTGKTYTLGQLGDGADGHAQRGIMVRAVDDIFDKTSEDKDAKYKIHASYLQLYMETVQDLWDPTNSDIQIQEDRQTGEVLLEPKPMSVELTDRNHIVQMLQLGEKNRTVANHKLNAHSSRSHAVLMITVSRHTMQNNAPTVQRGKLLLVDLAGSERQKSTQSQGQTLEEAKFINLSLTTLGKCINSLVDQNQQGHVPYRESKLTRLLKDSFGGSARTSLVVNVGPSVQYFSETLNTTKFGQRAIKIENTLRRRELVDYKALCRMQMQQVDLLTAALENAELAREVAENDCTAMQAIIDKEADIENQRNQEMTRLMQQLELKQKEIEEEKQRHNVDMNKSQARLQQQLDMLQEQIQDEQNQAKEAQQAAAKAREEARAAAAKAAASGEGGGKDKIVEVEKIVEKQVVVSMSEPDPKMLMREKKLENVLMILQRELIDLKGKIDDMELKHKQEVTACHQSWQQRLMYELKAKDKQIEYLQKTLEGCKAALSSKGADGASKKVGRSFIDKMLGRKGAELPEQPTKFVRLSSMFNPTVESSPKWVEEVKADVCSSCSIFGQVEDVRVDTHSPKGLIYIAFGNPKTAHRAVVAIKGHLGDISYEFLTETYWKDSVAKLSEVNAKVGQTC